MELYYRVREVFRALVPLCDPDYLNLGDDAAIGRFEDAARLAKDSYDQLRAFEDSGKDCVLTEGTTLLWWGQSVCMAISILGTWAAYGFEESVDERMVVPKDDLPEALYFLAKHSFDRVSGDPVEFERAQAAKLKEMEASA